MCICRCIHIFLSLEIPYYKQYVTLAFCIVPCMRKTFPLHYKSNSLVHFKSCIVFPFLQQNSMEEHIDAYKDFAFTKSYSCFSHMLHYL